jgi:anti-sigma factor RsiW
MPKLTEEMLERYLDGEMSPKKAKQVEHLLDAFPEHRESLAELTQLGDLLRLMSEERVKEVSFEGFSTQIERDIREEASHLPLSTRASIWIGEFFDNRRVVWVPAVATVSVLALALVFVFLPANPSSPTTGAPAVVDKGIQLHTGYTPLVSSINSVDFGELTGTHYSIKNDQGDTVGVVWINESP